MEIQTQCPVCKGSKIDFMYYISSETATQYFFKRSEDENKFLRIRSNIEKIWKDNKCAFLLCKECSFVFAYPFVAGTMELYSSIYDTDEAYPKTKWEYQKTYEVLEKKIGLENLTDAKFLEIGAGNGAFIKTISPEMIKKSNVVSTEYSKTGQIELENYNIKCYSTDIREPIFLEYSGYFDIVCVFQVLEHLDNLDDFFNRLDLITNKNANIFIAVPNYQMRKFFDSLSCYIDIPPIHISRWNQSCFSYITKRYNWSIEEYQIEPQKYHLKILRFLRITYPKTKMFSFIKTINISLVRKIGHISGAFVFALIHLPSIFKLKSDNYAR